MIREGEIQEFRAQVAELPNRRLYAELVHNEDCEWRWNSVADEINRRRKALRLRVAELRRGN